MGYLAGPRTSMLTWLVVLCGVACGTERPAPPPSSSPLTTPASIPPLPLLIARQPRAFGWFGLDDELSCAVLGRHGRGSLGTGPCEIDYKFHVSSEGSVTRASRSRGSLLELDAAPALRDLARAHGVGVDGDVVPTRVWFAANPTRFVAPVDPEVARKITEWMVCMEADRQCPIWGLVYQYRDYGPPVPWEAAR